MWEPSELPWEIELLHTIYEYDNDSQKYIDKEDGQCINETFFNELQTTNSISTFSSIQINTLIISAEGSQDIAGKRYRNGRNDSSVNLHIIKDTDNLFSQKRKSRRGFYSYIPVPPKF